MDNTVIVALIAAGGGIVTQLAISIINRRETEKIINYRIGELEKRVTKHNDLIERVYGLETNVNVLDEKICALIRAK